MGKGLYAAAAKAGERRAFLISNVGDAPANVSVSAGQGAFTLYRVDAAHAKLTETGLWQEGPLTVPANGVVLALSGTSLAGASETRSAQGPVNGLQR
jgi:hypothetical protein